jgi:hypothetical protein
MIRPTLFLEVPEDHIHQFPVPELYRDACDPMFYLAPHPCRVVVELGSEFGFWTYRAARNFPDAQIWCIDPWGNPPPKKGGTGDRNFIEWEINTHEFRNRVFPLRMLSQDASAFFNLPIDFLFIDGDHSVAGVERDLRLWTPKVRPGGLVVGHDWGDRHYGPRVQRGVDNVWGIKNVKVDKLYISANGMSDCFWRRM